MNNQVFVYGTLKRQQINHQLLEGVGIQRIRKAILHGVTLFDITDPVRPYPYPALLRGQGQLLGELIELKTQQHPDDALLVLDHLEMEGFEYHRVKCWISVQGQLERAWVYLYASRRHLQRAKGKPRIALTWSPRRY
jgi:gamma-glutamylcyclotransferase (GGCT)/AIG2-like uncharacterized protein YtfP